MVDGLEHIFTSPFTNNSILKFLTIYQVHLYCGRNSGWSETYIQLSIQHQLIFLYFKSNSGWYLVTYIHIYQYILRDYERKSGWSNLTYVHNLR